MNPWPGFGRGHHVHGDTDLGCGGADGLAGVALVDPHVCDSGSDLFRLAQQLGECSPVLHVSWGDDGEDQHARAVDEYVAFDAVDLFGSVESSWPRHGGCFHRRGVHHGGRWPVAASRAVADFAADRGKNSGPGAAGAPAQEVLVSGRPRHHDSRAADAATHTRCVAHTAWHRGIHANDAVGTAVHRAGAWVPESGPRAPTRCRTDRNGTGADDRISGHMTIDGDRGVRHVVAGQRVAGGLWDANR